MTNTKYIDLAGKITEILDKYKVLDEDTTYPIPLEVLIDKVDVSNFAGIVFSILFGLFLVITLISLVFLIHYYVVGSSEEDSNGAKYTSEEHPVKNTLLLLVITAFVYFLVFSKSGTPTFTTADTHNLEEYSKQLTALYKSSSEELVEYKPYNYTNINLTNLPEVLYQTEDSIKTVAVYKYKEDSTVKEPVLVKRTLKKEYSKLKDWDVHRDYAVLLVPEGYDIVNNQTGTVTSLDTD